MSNLILFLSQSANELIMHTKRLRFAILLGVAFLFVATLAVWVFLNEPIQKAFIIGTALLFFYLLYLLTVARILATRKLELDRVLRTLEKKATQIGNNTRKLNETFRNENKKIVNKLSNLHSSTQALERTYAKELKTLSEYKKTVHTTANFFNPLHIEGLQGTERYLSLLAVNGFSVQAVEGEDLIITQNLAPSVRIYSPRNYLNLIEVCGRNSFYRNAIQLISKDDEFVLFDLGFNKGYATLMFGVHTNCSRIHAFEPFEAVYKYGERCINLNPDIAKKTVLHQAGLGGHERVETGFFFPNRPSASTIVPAQSTQIESEGQYVPKKIDIQVLDAAKELGSLLRDCDQKVILKIDVEGAEYEIFESLQKANLLTRFDMILGEYHHKGIEPILNTLGDVFSVIEFQQSNKYGDFVAHNQVDAPPVCRKPVSRFVKVGMQMQQIF